ncbi:MAG TPA: hypothetical protein EYM57_03320 [Gammaproteobacteria bacterium]|nr:hypothetical protein [Gammaproteobacteria bacterium]
MDQSFSDMAKDVSKPLMLSETKMALALRLGARILAGWQTTTEESATILMVPSSIILEALDGSLARIELESEQVQRIALLVDIDLCLRALFSNPENALGFMRMGNNNPFFGGCSPLEKVLAGDIQSLREVAQHIRFLRML